MSDPISISKTLSIRECGKDEYWLQGEIYNDPSILGLGELDVISKERQQSSGGRLDLMLGDSETGTMYEVEVMLGETNESHIIRAIEYWDLERRRRPKQQHIAVLVAETITRRFFNVVQLLGNSIPIIAIQANIIEADGRRALHFTKILDVLRGPEEEAGESEGNFGEDWWRTNEPLNVANAEAFSKVTGYRLTNSFTKNYVALRSDGNIHFSFRKRSGGKSRLACWLTDTNISAITTELDRKGLSYDAKPYDSGGQMLRMTLDKKLIESNSELFTKLAAAVNQSWQQSGE